MSVGLRELFIYIGGAEFTDDLNLCCHHDIEMNALVVFSPQITGRMGRGGDFSHTMYRRPWHYNRYILVMSPLKNGMGKIGH